MRARRETIMVVEDDEATREFLADNLRADSYGVITAATMDMEK